jgi:hypothetical protein
MKKHSLPIGLVLLAFSFGNLSADDAVEAVLSAANKLKESENYTWKAEREGSRFWRGTVEGQIKKDGTALVSMPGRDGSFQTAFLLKKSAAETQDGWRSAEELENAEGFGRFLVFILRGFKPPAAELEQLVKHSVEPKLESGKFESKLKEDGVKELLSFGDGNGPTVKNPAGSLKISLKDGIIESYELSLQGSMSFNGNDFDLNRVTKVEILKIGETEFELPAKAMEKLK